MRRTSTTANWFLVFLLLLITVGCGDPDAKPGTFGATAPTVLSVAPPAGSLGVCSTTIVTATFSEAMDPSSLTSNFSLTGPNGATVAGVVTYTAGSNTATFQPAGPLALNTLYTATVSAGAKDLFGNTLASNYTWNFTTGVAACSTVGSPSVVAVTPANGACPNSLVTAKFN